MSKQSFVSVHYFRKAACKLKSWLTYTTWYSDYSMGPIIVKAWDQMLSRFWAFLDFEFFSPLPPEHVNSIIKNID
jgi:hypothetical protein